MKRISKKTAGILILLGLFLLTVMGVTIAYYTSQKDFKNEFTVSEPGVAIQEKFNPSDFWVPGEEKSKEVWFTNTGKMDMLLRFSVEVEWADDNHPDRAAEDVVTLYWNDGNGKRVSDDSQLVDFVKKTQRVDTTVTDYYYYTKVLKAGESTQHILESVKFAADLSNDGHDNSDYSNTQINITIKGETVLADPDAAADQWKELPQITAVITGDRVAWN